MYPNRKKMTKVLKMVQKKRNVFFTVVVFSVILIWVAISLLFETTSIFKQIRIKPATDVVLYMFFFVLETIERFFYKLPLGAQERLRTVSFDFTILSRCIIL